ncbi:hypothetical protein LWC34_47540 [Kibdelosporangium philippinense]|uniref:Uncharacterized protein n=2 Tax=Kibdelosporangium philippinense TaxID=211113 RepID=A0ABS8ZRP2_9PSEU|nr:hypothetical protein [Kibdelosporangium philippinense]MCE7010410.1 hypothetical protein [Kibdelosporangium philippinense]
MTVLWEAAEPVKVRTVLDTLDTAKPFAYRVLWEVLDSSGDPEAVMVRFVGVTFYVPVCGKRLLWMNMAAALVPARTFLMV